MKFTTKGHQELNWENILKHISTYDMFKYYISSFKTVKKPFCSELRKDRKPSCSIKILSDGTAIYKDFSTNETFTIISYLKNKYSLAYMNILIMISNDFGLGMHDGIKKGKSMIKKGKVYKKQPKYKGVSIEISSKNFNKKGILYWEQYGITKEILSKFEVKQITAYSLNGQYGPIGNYEIAFAYYFGNGKYKLLRPERKEYKWMTNCKSKDVQGIRQLPTKGKTLLITKSLKDIMTLYSIGAHSIAPQSESTLLSLKGIEKTKQNWEIIFIYYDNDEAGLRMAKEHSKLYGIPYIYNPLGSPKDASDYYKKYGKEKLQIMLKKLLDEVNIHTGQCAIIEKQQNQDIQGDIPF